MAYCLLRDAPYGTILKFVWKFQNRVIFENQLGTPTISQEYILDIVSGQNAPVGEYSIEIYIDNRRKPEAIIKFTIEE